MAELQGKKRRQPSSCPEGWLPAAMVVQLELTCRQERYTQRCVGIARFVYNRMVADVNRQCYRHDRRTRGLEAIQRAQRTCRHGSAHSPE